MMQIADHAVCSAIGYKLSKIVQLLPLVVKVPDG